MQSAVEHETEFEVVEPVSEEVAAESAAAEIATAEPEVVDLA